MKKLTLAENPALEVLTFEEAGKKLTEEVKQFCQNWLRVKYRRTKKT